MGPRPGGGAQWTPLGKEQRRSASPPTDPDPSAHSPRPWLTPKTLPLRRLARPAAHRCPQAALVAAPTSPSAPRAASSSASPRGGRGAGRGGRSEAGGARTTCWGRHLACRGGGGSPAHGTHGVVGKGVFLPATRDRLRPTCPRGRELYLPSPAPPPLRGSSPFPHPFVRLCTSLASQPFPLVSSFCVLSQAPPHTPTPPALPSSRPSDPPAQPRIPSVVLRLKGEWGQLCPLPK